MRHAVELDLRNGNRISIDVPAPVPAPTCYILSIRFADAKWLWPMVRQLCEAGGRPVCDYPAQLQRVEVKEQDVSDDSLFNVLKMEGCTFGIMSNPGPLRRELDATGRKSVLFMRDPRDIVAKFRAASPDTSDQAFLNSILMKAFLEHCQEFTDFCCGRDYVTVLHLEDARRDFPAFARKIAHALNLRLAPARLVSIAGIAAKTPGLPAVGGLRDRFAESSRAEIESMFAETLACFGYVPETAPPTAFLDHWGAFSQALSSRLATPSEQTDRVQRDRNTGTQASSHAPTAEGVIEVDPELLWRLKINGNRQITILGRRISLQTDEFGCRPVRNQPSVGEKTLAAYGCSFTFGAALPYEETFCSVLQSSMPSWRIENHGTGAYGTVQNLIQLRRASRWNAPNYVTFCFIQSHLLRNVADISFRRLQMNGQTGEVPPRPYPRAALNENGQLQFRYATHPRWDLDGLDLSDFSHDAHYLDLVTARVFERAADTVRQFGGHFFITKLQGDFSTYLRGRLDAAGIPIVDAGLNGPQYTCLPDDGHPNTIANRIFAERIHTYVTTREASLAPEQAGAPAT